MASTPSTRLRVELQAAGENLNTWGNPKLTDALKRLEEAISGRQALVVSGPVTLVATNYVADQARNMFLDCTGTGGTITIPAVEKVYLVRNGTSGSVILTTGSGTTATLVTGQIEFVVTSGSNTYLNTGLNKGGDTYSGETLPFGARGQIGSAAAANVTDYYFDRFNNSFLRHNFSTGILTYYRGGTPLFSVDASGNAIFLGTVTTGTPIP